MRSLALVAAISMCGVIGACHAQEASLSDQARSQSIQKLARSLVTQRGIPGVAIAIIRDGKLFQKATFGSADLGTHQQVSSSTPFQLASTTKIFASAGVLRLIADGKVKLQDPIGRYLNGLPPTWGGVTIRQLLSHTSGLPDVTTSTGDVDLVAQDWDGALPIVANRPFQFRPGTYWAYTQTNYALLLRLIEHVSGAPFEDFLQKRLFKPLEMRDTFFPGPQRSCAVNYKLAQNGSIVERPDLKFPHYVHAAGGLCSSLDDLIAWNRGLDSGKVVPRQLIDEAQQPTKLADGSNARIAGSMSYGLGWAIETAPGHRWAGHSGGNSTAFRRYLDDHMTIIVLHNGASDPDAIASSIARLMLQQTAGGDPQSSLWDAAGNGDVAAAQAALRAGADINKLDTTSSRNGRYPLNWAAFNNHPDLIRFLLAHGAKINAQNLTGFTALHHAAESGSAEAAQTLLASGADPSIRNANGETPSDVARRKANEPVVRTIDGWRKRAK